MKKIFIIMVFVLTVILSGCSTNESDKDNKDNQDTQIQIQENVVDTKYYTVMVPEDWKDLYEWMMYSATNNQYTLGFYEKESHAEIEGGFLFGISLYLDDEDYSYLPSYDILGTLKVENQSFTVIVEYPTDVQFTEDTANAYHQLSDDIDKVLKSFQAKNGCTFEKNDN